MRIIWSRSCAKLNFLCSSSTFFFLAFFRNVTKTAGTKSSQDVRSHHQRPTSSAASQLLIIIVCQVLCCRSLSRGDNNCQWGFAWLNYIFQVYRLHLLLRFAAFIVFQIITWANINSKWHLAMMKTGFSRFRLETANSISDWGQYRRTWLIVAECDATCVYPSLPKRQKKRTL